MTAAIVATQLTTPDLTRPYTVTVNSALDITNAVYLPSLMTEDQGTNVQATTAFEVRGLTLASLPNLRGQALVEVYDHTGGVRAARGFIDSHEPDMRPGGEHAIRVSCSDHTSLLDNVIPFEARPEGESDRARLGYLWGRYSGSYLNADFSQVQQIAASLPAQVFAGISLRQAIDMIAAQASTSARWYLDLAGRLHYFTSETNFAPFDITSDAPAAGDGFLLMESADHLLLETGDSILLEGTAGSVTEIVPHESLRIDFDSKNFTSRVFVRGKTEEGSGWVYSEAAKLVANGLQRDRFLDAPDCTTEAMKLALGRMYLGRLNAARARGSFTIFSPDSNGVRHDGWQAEQNVNVRSSQHDVDQSYRIARVHTTVLGPANNRRYDIEFGNARAGSDSGMDPPIVMGRTINGDLVDDNGALLLSASPNAFSGGLGPSLRRYITSGLYNSDFAVAPPAADSAIVNTWNPLPFWRYVVASGASIFAYSREDSSQGSGRSLRFDMIAGAAGDKAYVEQIAPINSSTNRAYSVSPYAYVEVASQSADCEFFVTAQFLQRDGETTTGSEFTFDLAANVATSELGLIAGANTAPPADAYFIRVRYGIQRRSGGSDTAMATVDFAETMLITADPRTHIAEVATPATWTRGTIQQFNGFLSLTPHGLVSGATYTPVLGLKAGASDGSVAGYLQLSDAFLRWGGTSFPAGAADGDLWYRTDLDLLCVYDGTRWLSEKLYSDLAAVGATAGATIPYTATQSNVQRWLAWGAAYGSDIWIEKVVTTFFVDGGTALSASHKWVGTGGAIIGTFADISSGASSAWRVATDTVDALLGVNFNIDLTWTKTGTPGSLYAWSRFFYRLVLT